jgi:serine/threonine protein kinase
VAWAEVYLVEHPRLPRQDALKVLPESMTADGDYRERFNREADLAARLFHPHIVGVHDRGEFNGRLWISMDYVEGTDAAQLVRDRYPAGMHIDEVLAIVAAVAGALDYAHQRGLLHRDVKPPNILLTRPDDDGERRILLAEGIALMVRYSRTIGSFAVPTPCPQLADIDLHRPHKKYLCINTSTACECQGRWIASQTCRELLQSVRPHDDE